MEPQQTDAIPVTALLATEAGVPITVFDSNAALRMAVVDRASVGGLGAEWDVPGVYLLLDPMDTDGCYDVYVGKAHAGRRSAPRQYNVTMSDLLGTGLLTAGEQLVSVRGTVPGTGTLNGDGTIQIDGQRFSSPSAAGSHLRDGKATNGWAMWAVTRDDKPVPLATIRARYLRAQQATTNGGT